MQPEDRQHIEQTAIESRERCDRDVRFRNRVQMVVAHVMQKHGAVNPRDPDREARDIALEVASTLLEMIYKEDAELHSLRHDLDHYRKTAERLLAIRPATPLILREPPGGILAEVYGVNRP